MLKADGYLRSPEVVHSTAYYAQNGISIDDFHWSDAYSRDCLDEIIKNLNICLYRYSNSSDPDEWIRMEESFLDLVPQCFCETRRLHIVPREAEILIRLIQKACLGADPIWKKFINLLKQVK